MRTPVAGWLALIVMLGLFALVWSTGRPPCAPFGLAEVVAFLDGLNGTQKRKLKKIAEGVIPDGETSASVH